MVTYIDIQKSRSSPSQSLKRHLALGFGLFTLLLSAGISFLVGHLATESGTRQIGDRLVQLAAEARDRLDYAMYDRFRALRLLAALDGGARTADAVAARRSRLEDLQQERPVYAWIGYADASGRVLTATKGMFEGTDVSGRPWHKLGLQGPTVEDVQELPSWPQRAGKPEGGPLRVVAIGVPVRDSTGRVTGVLGAYLDWDALRELRSPLAGVATLFVLSRDGRVLSGIQALEGKKLDLQAVRGADPVHSRWLLERWPDGDRYLTAVSVTRGYAEYPGAGWKVVMRQDAGEALADVGRMQMQVVAGGALLGLVFAGLAWWFAARVARPLVTIADVADRLSSGERDVSIPAATGYAEVERLGASLRTMLSSLRRQEEDLLQARDKLELRVRERAAELTRTRADLEATIVEREHVQREVVRAKERLDLALDAAEVAVWTYDLASGRIALSEQWAVILGGAHGVTETSIEDVTSLVPEPEREEVREAIAAVAKGLRAYYVVRHHVQRANGELLLTESRGKVVERGPDGRAVRMAGTVRALDGDSGRPAPPPRARHGS